MIEPLVSIIIPVYRASTYLRETLNSVDNQTFSNWEIIAVDDNGCYTEDRSLLLQYRRFFGQDRFKIIEHTRNRGTAAARKSGFIAAQGDFVAFLDADDVYQPRRLEVFIDILRTHGNVVMAHGAIMALSEEPSESADIENWFSNNRNSGFYYYGHDPNFLLENHICLSTAVAKKSHLALDDFPDEMNFQYEDWVLWNRLANKGAFYYHNAPLTGYRIHQHSFSTKIKGRGTAHILAYIEMFGLSYQSQSPLPRPQMRKALQRIFTGILSLFNNQGNLVSSIDYCFLMVNASIWLLISSVEALLRKFFERCRFFRV